MSKKKKFKGNDVFDDHGYPAVYMPEHPDARDNGAVRVHQVVAREKWSASEIIQSLKAAKRKGII